MRSLLGTKSVWLNLEPVATSILLSSSHGCDEGLQHLLRLWLRFGRRNRESQHITLCLTLSMSFSLCLPTFICLSLSVASTYAHKLAARHSLKFLWKPQTSPFTHPTLIAPLRLTCACTHIHTCAHTHCQEHVYLKELKGGLPHQLSYSFLQWSEPHTHVKLCACMCCRSSHIRRVIIKHFVEVHNHRKLTASVQNSIWADHLWAVWQMYIWLLLHICI